MIEISATADTSTTIVPKPGEQLVADLLDRPDGVDLGQPAGQQRPSPISQIAEPAAPR